MRFAPLARFLCALPALAQSPLPPFEAAASGWRTEVAGEIQSGIVPVDLRSDLAVERRRQWTGTALIRVGGNHRLVVEGSPYRFKGDNVLNRTVVYNGRTYLVRERVTSRAELDYAFAGHQWDFLAGDRGNLGWRNGVAYLGARGTIASASTGVTASRDYRLPLPLTGVHGRAEIVRRLVAIDGGVQGMALGDYGHFVQGGVGATVMAGPVGFRAGYLVLDSNVHERGRADANRAGVALRLDGPVFGIVVRLGASR